MISNLEITEKCTQSEEDVTQSEQSTDTVETKEALRSDPLSSSKSEINDRSILERSTSTILTSMEVVSVENDVEIDAHNPESMLQIFLQSFVPFFLGGIGSILAGLLLMYVNRTLELLKEVPELLVLIPPLQGLKGNLDMTFSARMSTMVSRQNFIDD
ncbi:unnamed protein product [Caenorhabditis angaria]|uniref:Uncharacterized protein n=1 Tax=Caenorhabditis angaria TaxID=860376 RepID=A0A9P1IU76_9PELO|nr:unnamed protein product [Caenorhabditis angaria]